MVGCVVVLNCAVSVEVGTVLVVQLPAVFQSDEPGAALHAILPIVESVTNTLFAL